MSGTFRRLPTKYWSIGSGLLTLIVMLGLWHFVCASFASIYPERAIFFPSPVQVFTTAKSLLASPSFWSALVITNLRVVFGFLAAAVLAIPLGLVLGAFPKCESAISPLTDFGRYLPVAALVPLTIVWVGVGDSQKVLVLALGAFFQLLVMVTDAVRRVPTSHIDTAEILGCHGFQLIWRILLPASWPQIFDACRVAVGLTWSYLLVAEVVASENGLGFIIIRGQRFLETDKIFVIIVVLGFLGLAYDRLFAISRKMLFRWANEERGHA